MVEQDESGTVPKSDNLKGGSRKGIPNKATSEARKAIADFVEGNAHKLTAWLTAVAEGDAEHDLKPNPAKAFELFQSVIEYHIPKLARTELTGKDGEALRIVATTQDEAL
jgi:hypothetical protein